MRTGRAFHIFGGGWRLGSSAVSYGFSQVVSKGARCRWAFRHFRGVFLERWGFGGLVPGSVVCVVGCFPGLGFALR